MSTFIYDEALVNKIKSWTSSSQIQVYSPNETSRLYEVMADKSGDEPIQLPIITISRNRGYEILNTSKRVMSYDGLTTDANMDYSTQLNAVPVHLTYQLDVYTRYADEADLLMRNLVFNLINYPDFTVDIPSADGKTHVATVSIGSTVEDNSDIPERFVAGNFYRLSLMFDINDAYLWDVRNRHNVSIDINIE